MDGFAIVEIFRGGNTQKILSNPFPLQKYSSVCFNCTKTPRTLKATTL